MRKGSADSIKWTPTILIVLAVWSISLLPTSAAEPTLAVDSLSCTTERGESGLVTFIVAEGTIRSLSSAPLKNLQITTYLLAPEGKRPVVRSYGPTLLDAPLAPGASVQFRSSTNTDKFEKDAIARCRIRIRVYGQKDWLALSGATETDFRTTDSQGGRGAVGANPSAERGLLPCQPQSSSGPDARPRC